MELSGYTARVSEMFAVFEDVQKGHYQRQIGGQVENPRDSTDGGNLRGAVSHGKVVDLRQMGSGKVVDTEGNIILKDVAIITPCGDVVVSSLSFEASESLS